MRRLGEVLALPSHRRRLLFRAAALLVTVALALRVVSVDRLYPSVVPEAAVEARPPTDTTVEDVGWAVRAAATALPGRYGCLVQAIAATALLRRAGHPATVTLGVRKADDGGLAAHSWVESGGTPVVGAVGPDAGFRRLGSLDDG